MLYPFLHHHREPFEDGSFHWLTAAEASTIFAALQYIGRCVVVNGVYGIGRVICFKEGKRPIPIGLERVIEAVSKNRDSGATYIQLLIKTCTTITEMSHVRFIICPKHKHCSILDGSELGTDAFGKTIRSVQDTCQQILDNKLTFGLIQCLDSSFWDEVEGLQDHLSERRDGFWFMSHPANKDVVNRWRKSFSRYMQTIGFSEEDKNFDMLKPKIFLERSEKFIKLVFWLLQSSHSPSTADDTYRVSAVDVNRIEASQLELFQYTSFVWHKTLILDDDCEIDTSVTCTTVGDEEKQEEEKTIENYEMPSEVCIKNNFLRDNLEKKSNILETVEVLSRKIDVQNMDQEIDNSNDRKDLPKRSCEALTEKHYHMQEKGLLLTKSVTNEMILHGVQKSLDHRAEEYWGENKSEAIRLGCTFIKEGLFIIPTGSGKILIYQVSVLLNNYCVVFAVVPIVSLQVDIMRRCIKIGIKAVSLEERNATGALLVLVSVENVFHDSYRSFFMEAHSPIKLHSIVVEEGHLFVQWKNFRPKIGSVKDKIRATGVHVPLFGLTAISSFIGICQSNDRNTMVRQYSDRHNISHRLRIIDQDEARFELFRDIMAYMRVYSHVTRDIRTIVFCLTRNDCEELKYSFDSFREKRITVSIYQAGMSKIDRNEQYRKRCDDNIGGGSAW